MGKYPKWSLAILVLVIIIGLNVASVWARNNQSVIVAPAVPGAPAPGEIYTGAGVGNVAVTGGGGCCGVAGGSYPGGGTGVPSCH